MSACLYCACEELQRILSLGDQPLATQLVSAEDLETEEEFYPLNLYICEACKLVQTRVVVQPEELLARYTYLSSCSQTALAHAREYANFAVREFGLNATSFVIEIGSNDGYLLQYFRDRNIRSLGVEPADHIAERARAKGIDTEAVFWSSAFAEQLVEDGRQADLIIANNVLAHVIDIKDFIAGIKAALKPRGVATIEFPHLYRLVMGNQFDTIYHEHYNYFTLFVAKKVFGAFGLMIYDVEEIDTQGGSLRLFVCHDEDTSRDYSRRVGDVLAQEEAVGMMSVEFYDNFAAAVKKLKQDIARFLKNARRQKKRVVACGAPTKGNCLLNACGVDTSLIEYAVEINPLKQGKFLPGTHIPIFAPERLRDDKPDYVFILPWNLREEIAREFEYIRAWGGKLVVGIPSLEIW